MSARPVHGSAGCTDSTRELVPAPEVQRLVREALERTEPGARVVVIVVPSSTPAEMPAALVGVIEQQQRALENVLAELVDLRREMRDRGGRAPEEQPTALERATFHFSDELRDHVEASYKRLRREGKARVRREGARK